MSESAPTPREAQAALTEANSQALRLRHADYQLGWILLCISAVYLAAAAVVSTVADPRRGGPVAGIAMLAIVIIGLGGIVLVGVRIRAYGRTGIRLYFGGIVAFNVWNSIVVGVSIGTRYWASTQPSYHFGVSLAVGSIPLLVAAWLILRR
jgi:hypothetical protein